MVHNLRINPVDWCLIQYLIGLDISANQISMEETFKLLLKQYILHFSVTSISSRDKKRLLEEFITMYNKFSMQHDKIQATLNDHWNPKPHDDLIVKTLEVIVFHQLNHNDIDWEQFLEFVYQNNPYLVKIVESIGSKTQKQIQQQ